jgi:hypothetical protein
MDLRNVRIFSRPELVSVLAAWKRSGERENLSAQPFSLPDNGKSL